MDNTHITGNMVIGADVFISVLVATTNDNNIGLQRYDEEKVVGPTIEDGVAIGAGANILPGVIVGEEAIVGAGAVATNNVPKRTLVVAIPAKVVREL